MDKVTLAQAKARWNAHTRRVLNSGARRLADDLTEWGTCAGAPMVRLGMSGQLILYFYRNDAGHVFSSREAPPKWFERKPIQAD